MTALTKDTRKLVVQCLYSLSYEPNTSTKAVQNVLNFSEDANAFDEKTKIVQPILESICASQQELEGLIEPHCPRWERTAGITRAVLTVAVWELQNHDTPLNRVIRESTALTRSLVNQDDVGFVQAVINKVAAELAPQEQDPS